MSSCACVHAPSSIDESLSTRYLDGLASLGKIPVEMTEEYIYIHGYSNSDP